MAAVKWLSGNMLSTPFSGGGMNSLPNNALIGSSGIDGSSGNLSLFYEIEGVFNYTAAPTANTGFSVWLIRSVDGGTNIESGNAQYTPNRIPDIVLPLQAIQGNQRTTVVVLAPPGNFLVLAKNDGTGQTTAATGNDLRIRPLTYQIL